MKVSRLALAFLLACSDPPPQESSVELPPRGAPTAQDSVARIEQARQVAADSACLALSPHRVSLTGVLRREVHLGTPGYGETPSQDERDTILVLELPSAIPVCPDFAQSNRDSVARIRKLQVTGRAIEGFDALGIRVTVYGSLSRAVRGTDFLPAGLRADSIPALRSRPRTSS